MKYHTYTIRAWYGNSMISISVVAISLEAAKADIKEAYGNPDLWQVSV